MKRSRRPGVIEDAKGPVGCLRYPISGSTQMTEHSLWRFSRALHRAINERQFAEIENLIDEDIEWTIHGPVEWFPFFGSRQGKAAVMEVIRQIAEKVRVHRFDRE